MFKWYFKCLEDDIWCEVSVQILWKFYLRMNLVFQPRLHYLIMYHLLKNFQYMILIKVFLESLHTFFTRIKSLKCLWNKFLLHFKYTIYHLSWIRIIEIFYQLTQTCYNIQSLIITDKTVICNSLNSLKDLISIQNNLK